MQTKLLAFDRQNHMGASNKAAGQISDAIRQEAEAQLADKKVVTGEVNIKQNVEKIKVMASVLSRRLTRRCGAPRHARKFASSTKAG